MADPTTTPAKGKAVPFPKTWSRMSTKEKQDWLAKYRPGHPQATKPAAPAKPAAPPAPVGLSPQAAEEPYQEPPADEPPAASQTPDDALHALCCAIANDLQSIAARSLLAQLLRGLADQLEAGGTGDESEEF